MPCRATTWNNPNHIGSDGYWPLLSFAESGDLPAIRWLLDHGADRTITDQCDFPCWHWTKDPATREFLKVSAEKRGMRE